MNTAALIPIAAEVQPAVTLADLAAQINQEHEACETAGRSTLRHAIKAGELLLDAKRQLEHGGLGPWLASKFQGSERTARAYMQMAKRWSAMPESKRQRVAGLSLRSALKELQSPKASDQNIRRPQPFAEMTVEDRRYLCEKWWDILASAVTLFDAAGWEPSDTAEFMGVSFIDDVLPILEPKFPIRGHIELYQALAGPGKIPMDKDRIALGHALSRWYATKVETSVAMLRANAHWGAAWKAEPNGLGHLRAGLDFQADHHLRRWQRLNADTKPVRELPEIFPLVMCAMQDVRVGLGIEKDQAEIKATRLPLAYWPHSRVTKR